MQTKQVNAEGQVRIFHQCEPAARGTATYRVGPRPGRGSRRRPPWRHRGARSCRERRATGFQAQIGHVADADAATGSAVFAVDGDDALADILARSPMRSSSLAICAECRRLPQIDGDAAEPRRSSRRLLLDARCICRWRVGVDHPPGALAIPGGQRLGSPRRSVFSASPPISAMERARSCRSESKAFVVCSDQAMWRRDRSTPRGTVPLDENLLSIIDR